ncbi:hypothetical protein FOZ62_008752 [Perkinsus olseni]|uniref:Uncharacterized protein n=1 Tax=Perkinsus olseni TaxID=32597 RepID=A0A7J6TRF2_PEROL|nr:hypothetical protein FOZ62_008752 [Perkinsus olseni]
MLLRRLAKVWDIFGVAHPMADLDKPVSQDFVYNSTVRGTEAFKDLETPLSPLENRFVRFRTFDLSYSPCRH